jgi:hypothetical protein
VIRTALLATMLATPLAALEQPWIGYWEGDGQDCAMAGDIGEEMPIELTRDQEFGMEYSCEFQAVTPLGVGQSWKVERKCLDAGFVEFWHVIMVLTAEDVLVMIDDQGGVSHMNRCEKVPQ